MKEELAALKDKLGYEYEKNNYMALHNLSIEHDFKICYHNPFNPYQWKRRKGYGVDLIIEDNDTKFYIEESFCSKKYYYRKNWFKNCRLKRFNDYPHDQHHIWIILTNEPSNFESVTDLAYENNVTITNFNGLIETIKTTRLNNQTNRLKKFLNQNTDFQMLTLNNQLLVTNNTSTTSTLNTTNLTNTNTNTKTNTNKTKMNKTKMNKMVYAYGNELTELDNIVNQLQTENINYVKHLLQKWSNG